MTTSNDQPSTDQVRFTIWPATDTSGIITDTDDALYTGRGGTFDRCESAVWSAS